MGPLPAQTLPPEQQEAEAKQRAENEALLKRAQENCAADTQAVSAIFRAMDEDLGMVVGGDRQWDPAALAERKKYKRPIVTSNRLKGAAKQITGEVYKSRPSIRVAPADGAAHPGTANLFEGLIRNIENRSGAATIYPMAVQSATHCGRGHIRLGLRWADEGRFDTPEQLERAFDMELFEALIPNQFAVRWDKNAKHPQYADAKRCTVYSEVDEKEFKATWPQAGSAGWAAFSQWATNNNTWRAGGKVIVAEYWEVKETPVRVVRLQHNRPTYDFDLMGQLAPQAPSMATTTLRDPDDQLLAEAKESGWSVIAEREAQERTICMHLLGGSDVLSGPHYWGGQRIPIFTVHGEVMYAGEERIENGIVRDSATEQRRLNLALSIETELIGQMPLSPYLVEDKMIEDYEDEWFTAARQPAAYLRYSPGKNGGKPERLPPPQVSSGVQQMAGNAVDGIKAGTGYFDAALGSRSNETSGVAIDARDEQSETSSYVYGANLAATLQAIGQEMVNVIPAIYSRRQMVTILGKDDAPAIVNLEAMRAQGLGLEIGRYQVICSQGVNYQTQRDKDNELLSKAADTAPDPLKLIFFKRLIANTQLEDKDEIIGEMNAIGAMTGLLPPQPQAGAPGAPQLPPNMPPQQGAPGPMPGDPMAGALPLPPGMAPAQAGNVAPRPPVAGRAGIEGAMI